ncbi:gustatory receptor 5a for trehalose-like [Bactrocera tryoni]|uniref:gustatory receptor 5a for trehalose-like n=1 Tax=Bactrocera tryoni TaxID=59916 RepID=UPI001A99F892|nr:gustatory receptor 5a for trehalose-like [Bactrocera tryoni]
MSAKQPQITDGDLPATHKFPQKQIAIMLNKKLKKKEVYKLKSRRCWITRGIRRGTRADFSHNGSFHEAVGPVFVIAQCFGLMPVRGVLAATAKGLSFSWLSFRTYYCLIYTLLTTVCTGLTLNMIVRSALEVDSISPLVFHVNALLVSIGFLRLAGKWPQLMRKWQRVELLMPPQQSWREREALSVRVHKVTFVLISLSLTEHLLSTISAIHFTIHCATHGDAVESYFTAVSSHIFLVFDYSTWLAWFGKILNVFMTFGWSYMDVFLMIIGIGLSSLFGQVQSSLELVKGQVMPETYWTRTRLQYRLICDLIEQVDSAVSGIIMLSFANNLFFVCIQLLRSINKMASTSHFIYFYASLSFLLGRTLAVSLYLSEINERSREPLGVIKHVPKEGYCAEVDRFEHEIAVDNVALTGLQYFNVTRGLILTVAGTIVTYELVLIQFQKEDKLWKCS